MAMSIAKPWHAGEEEMHRLLRVPDFDNPTAAMLTPHSNNILQQSPLLALGTVDSEGRLWSTVWGGAAGLSNPLGSSMIAIGAFIDAKFDPVAQSLCDGREDGEIIIGEEGQQKMISGLAINLMRRRRAKFYGRVTISTMLRYKNLERGNEDSALGKIVLNVRVEESTGNCPKYLNKKQIHEATLAPNLESEGSVLSKRSLELIGKADLFFISSRNELEDMDTNHRGGPPGFVRVVSNDASGAVLIYPEYSGNRLYQTLGNLRRTPLAGLVFPDFETGDVLYVTGTTEILIGKDAANVMPRSNLAVKVQLAGARLVRQGLGFRGTPDEPSPYNPTVRLLVSEGSLASKLERTSTNTATLARREIITPTISRFRFALEHPTKYRGGQWVAMDFSQELDMGYSHMRDDDPRSLNDDFVRTFTVSSPPILSKDEQSHFEITIRRIGPVTSFLCSRLARPGLEIPVQGFGGDFTIEQDDTGQITPFVAGGVGITPLLSQLPAMDASKLRILWTLNAEDINLALDSIQKYPNIGPTLTLFVTGKVELSEEQQDILGRLQDSTVKVERRRLTQDDVLAIDAQKWYICTGTSLRKVLLQWLEGKSVFFEDFNF